ncbi:MAG: M3 family metallopeptidase [Chloroflexota bacterium]|nr:M3 family metallopeptidase [Chloroflexota bacterium]
MSPLTLDRLRRGGQALMEELSREYYLAHAGLKPTAELRPIYARHAAILGDEALGFARETFQRAVPGSEEHRSARLLLEWQVESQAQRALAELDEREIAWESAAIVPLPDGRRLPFQRASIEIANASDRGERLTIEHARAELVARELAPLRRERFQRDRDLTESLGIAPDAIATFEVVSGINLTALAAECDSFLCDTQPMWDETVAETVRTKLGIRVEEATRADALALLRAREYDRYFPSSGAETAVRRQLAKMAVDADASGRIHYDTGEREGKRARAFCAPVRIPQEVYLVLRPHGGQADYRTLLHELGHALHFANTRPDQPFEYRWIGDNSVTEAYAMLFDHLIQDAGWLLRYTALGRANVATFRRSAGFEELQFLRRYCAKLIYETALYGGRVGWDALPEYYVETLTNATSFRYQAADAFVDVDPHFYAARYLRAWQFQALLAETLVERFDTDWYRNPRAGPWLVQNLFAEGQRELADEIADRVAGRPLSFAPLVRSTEALLVAS